MRHLLWKNIIKWISFTSCLFEIFFSCVHKKTSIRAKYSVIRSGNQVGIKQSDVYIYILARRINRTLDPEDSSLVRYYWATISVKRGGSLGEEQTCPIFVPQIRLLRTNPPPICWGRGGRHALGGGGGYTGHSCPKDIYVLWEFAPNTMLGYVMWIL